MRTSKDDGHRHEWFRNKEFTTINAGHKHKIDLRKMIALPNKPGAHNHRLLKK